MPRLLPLLLALALLPSAALTNAEDLKPRPAPEFTQGGADAWVNSRPVTLAHLRGQVVLLDIWTFDCWNCYRSFPWLNDLEKRYADQGLQVIGIHSPEFAHEHERGRVEEKVDQFKLRHPVMMDNDFAYWKALGNRYWPTFYLIDKQGRLRARFIGETHSGDPGAQAIEAALKELLSAGAS